MDGHEPEHDQGFTLIEMVMAIALSAFVFLALGTTMLGGLRTLTVAKARSQGNEVATQAIEDLQRYPYDNLGTCGAPTGITAPTGLTSPVVSTSSSCPTTTPTAKAAFGDQPCLTAPALKGIPAASYSCTRLARAYAVDRFVGWTDAGHSAKRVAVLVHWRDEVGTHTVSQQSSLRAPVTGDIAGVSPPAFPAEANNPLVSLHALTIAGPTSGALTTSALDLTATTTGLTDAANDRVFASFTVVDGSGAATTGTVPLGNPTPAGTGRLRWTATLTPGGPLAFPAGSQYVRFTAVRATDGKTGSVIDPAPVLFCPAGGCTGMPSFTTNPVPQSTTTVAIDASGALASGGISLSATTKLLGPEDLVQALVVTRSGVVPVTLIVDTTKPCSPDPASTCTWTGSVSASSGYAFDAGSRAIQLTGLDTATNAASAAATVPLTFQVTP